MAVLAQGTSLGVAVSQALFSFMDRTFRCNILIRFLRVSFGQAFLFRFCFVSDLRKATNASTLPCFFLRHCKGLAREEGWKRGGGCRGRGRGGRGLANEDLLSLLHVFFWAEMALPGFLSCRCCAQQPLHQQPLVFLCDLAKVLRDAKVKLVRTVLRYS